MNDHVGNRLKRLQVGDNVAVSRSANDLAERAVALAGSGSIAPTMV